MPIKKVKPLPNKKMSSKQRGRVIMQSIFSSLIALLFLFSVGCRGKSNAEKTVNEYRVSTSGKIFLAENVMLGLPSIALAQDSEILDSSTKIRSDQIQLNFDDSSAVGRLKSKNLRDALQNEVAPKLSDILVGTWNVSNIASLSTGIGGTNPNVEKFDPSGQVKFDKNLTATLISGSVSALGLKKDFNNDPYPDYCSAKSLIRTTKQFVNMLLLDWGPDFLDDNMRYQIVNVAIEDKAKIVLFVNNGLICGRGVLISELTKI